MEVKKALTIAGSDCSGGAGIQADLKTFHSLGVYGMSVITALTAQNTLGVEGIEETSADFVDDQMKAVLEDIPPDAIKTGMLFSKKIIQTVTQMLAESSVRNIIVDPVMISTTGHKLITESAVQSMMHDLIPHALIVTPNIDEAKTLSGIMIDTIKDMKIAAERISDSGAKMVVVKGGHLNTREAVDIFFDGETMYNLTSERIPTRHTHGTGCTFSAAIAAYLALGKKPLDAVKKAKDYVTGALQHVVPVGKGISPINHLWSLGSRE